MHTRFVVIALVLALCLAVPTAAVSLEQESTSDPDPDIAGDLEFEATSQYAAIEDGELVVKFDRLNENAVTSVDELFRVTAVGDDPAALTVTADSAGVTFSHTDDGTEIDSESPLELEPEETAGVGIAVDSATAERGTSTFSFNVTEDDEPGPPTDDPDDPEPTELELVNLEVSETEVNVGDTITVTGTYEGVDQERTITSGLTVDGVVTSQQEVTVPANGEQTVTFERTMDAAGSYEVGIDNQSETVTVTEPDPDAANLTISNATVVPTTLEPGETATASATVTNEGNQTGERTVEFAVGGFVTDSTTVTLEPGESTTVSFDQQFGQPGSYAIAIGGEDVDSVTVVGPSLASSVTELPSSAQSALAVPVSIGVAFAFYRRRGA